MADLDRTCEMSSIDKEIEMLDIQKISDAMNQHHPRSKYAKKTSAQYCDIATHYVNVIATEIAKGIAYNRNLFVNSQWIHLNETLIYKTIDYRYNGNQRWITWLKYNFPLFTQIQQGNNMTGKLSLVKPHKDILEYIIKHNNINPTNTKMVKHLVDSGEPYKDTDIDCENLECYIRKTQITLADSETVKKGDRYTRKLLSNMLTAQSILDQAQDSYPKEGVLRQVYKTSEDIDRVYLKGTNLQSCSKETRWAALGNCVELDLYNFVYCYYASVIEQANPDKELNQLRAQHPIVEYALNKRVYRDRFAKILYKNWSKPISKELAERYAKTVLTALSFGGSSDSYYPDLNGNMVSGSLRDTIKCEQARAALKADTYFKMLKRDTAKFFREYSKYLKETEPKYTDKQKFTSAASIVSHKFRCVETELMMTIQQMLDINSIEVKLWVHDAVYVDQVSASQTEQINDAIAQIYQTEFFRLSRTVPDKSVWHWSNPDLVAAREAELKEHFAFIQQQEALATGYTSDLTETTNNPYGHNLQLGKHLYDALQREDIDIDTLESDPEALYHYNQYCEKLFNKKIYNSVEPGDDEYLETEWEKEM